MGKAILAGIAAVIAFYIVVLAPLAAEVAEVGNMLGKALGG